MNKEYLNVILADDDEGNIILFKNIFKDLKIAVKVQSFQNGKDLMEYLNNAEAFIPEMIMMNYTISQKSSLECLEEIKIDLRLSNMITAIYSDSLPEEDIERILVKGANIYIKKPDNYKDLKRVVSDVITLNWQYQTSGLNKDNFILKIG
ncbi:transcriptional regulator [Chryseobacterium piperi]|uniref:Transcriptional regulator n=1 Tax=Chryseobacterium piperi TaxID=558152 RepID=A0A086BL44_9FLAO|nr:response regulator [Chryseobacterium piperi]ASW74617.1 response regulator [Chryseobacterium piperi]KFF29658.1 transcriptional regulator [Chryseobacterium piperi]